MLFHCCNICGYEVGNGVKTTILLGPPGTGKTTSLLSLLQESLDRGVRPSKIGFISFTKKAVGEAMERAQAKFSLSKDDLPYFRTIHSLAFRQTGLSPRDVMGPRHYREFAKSIGVEILGKNPEDGDVYELPHGDRLLFISGLARVRCEQLRKTWEEVGEDLDFWEVEQFSSSLAAYKGAHKLVDFTDMLATYESKGPFPELDVLFVDEAQDLSRLQWNIVRRMSEHAKEVYLAGDDDQAIFRWSGADIDTFINYPGAQRVLDQSYRIPRPVQDFAGRFVSGLTARREKTFKPAPHPGTVVFESCLEDVDLSKGEWLVLVRNGYQTKDIEEHCRTSGFHYSCKGKSPSEGEALDAIRIWTRQQKGKEITQEEAGIVAKYRSKKAQGGAWYDALDKLDLDDKDYFRSCLRRNELLTGRPRIRISTIHGAKGSEAQNVLLYTDMSLRTYEGMQKDPDSEARVFYVGATRAKENLHVMQPQTQRFMEC